MAMPYFTIDSLLPEDSKSRDPKRNTKHKLKHSAKHDVLLVALNRAIDLFIARRMEYFDPTVGENSCQIRATMLVELMRSDDIDARLTTMRDGNLSRDGTVIFLAYLLTLPAVAADYPVIKIDPTRLFPAFTKTCNRHLIKKCQQRLSELSVDYIGRNHLAQFDSEGRHIMPFYYSILILIEKWKARKLDLILKIDYWSDKFMREQRLIYSYDDTQYKVGKQSVNGAIVIQVKTFREAVEVPDIIELVKQNIATHPQYVGISCEYHDDECERYKQLALAQGNCRDNPSNLFIQHIYPVYHAAHVHPLNCQP